MKYEILNSVDGQFYFVLKARNGEIIVTSETYKTKQACKKGISSVKRNALMASIKDLTQKP